MAAIFKPAPPWRVAPLLSLTLLILGLLSGCATPDKELIAHKGYAGSEIPDESIAIVKLEDAGWAQFGDLRVERPKYNSIKLQPGTYHVAYEVTFGVSYLVDTRMIVSYTAYLPANLQAGRIYKLRGDRTYGYGYRVFFWIEDDSGEVIAGTKKP